MVGGLSVIDVARVVLADGSSVRSNIAGGVAGGLGAWGNASNVLTGGSSVQGNTANQSGGGVFADDSTELNITSSSVAGNTAQGNGGGLHVRGNTRSIVADGSLVSDNTAAAFKGRAECLEQCQCCHHRRLQCAREQMQLRWRGEC